MTTQQQKTGFSKEFLAKFSFNKEKQWKCMKCLVVNSIEVEKCVSCEELPSAEDQERIAKKKGSSLTKAPPVSINTKENNAPAFSFGVPVANESSMKRKEMSAAAPTMGFSFGIPPGQQPVTKKSKKTDAIPFTFGIPAKPTSTVDITSFKTRHGKVFVFGSGDCGQLGLGDEVFEAVKPELVEKLSKVSIAEIKCGGMHTLALAGNGTDVYTWGCDDDKVLGREGDEMIPLKLDTSLMKGESIKKLAAGDCHSALITDQGKVYSWGTYRDDSGYVGHSASKLKEPVPQPVEFKRSKQKIVSIASGDNHTLAVDAKGKVFSWGAGAQQQLARRVLARHKVLHLAPQSVALGRKKAMAVFCGGFHSFALMDNGHVYSWGLNNFGQLGHGDRDEYMKPTCIEALEGGSPVIALDGGVHHSIALTKDGSVYTFGRADSGQLGVPGLAADAIYEASPQQVVGVNSIVEIAAGGNHSMALTKAGEVYVWGFGEMNQLGTGLEQVEPLPVKLDFVAPVTHISAGGQFSAMIAQPKKSPSAKENTLVN